MTQWNILGKEIEVVTIETPYRLVMSNLVMWRYTLWQVYFFVARSNVKQVNISLVLVYSRWKYSSISRWYILHCLIE